MEQHDNKLFEGDRNAMQGFAPFLTLGIQLALSIVVFFFSENGWTAGSIRRRG